LVHRDDDFIYFEALDASHTSKYLGLTLTLITIVITTPMMYNIVYFVTNCHFRTLVNRLIGFEFTITIIWNFTVNFTSVIRYLSGPFPIILCQLEYLNKNVMTMTLILLINIILIIRYIFIFKSKNPTAVQDDFWILFLGIWTVGFALICQTTTLIFPGKMPMTFYLCVGKMPKSLIGVKVKKNASFNFISLLAIICYTFIHIRFTIHKHKGNKKTVHAHPQQPPSHTGLQYIILNRFNQENLFSLAITNVAIIVLILSVIAPTIINETDPAIMDVYPHYLWVYLHQHFTFNIGILLVVFLHHRKKPALANPFRDWIKDVIVLVRKPFN
jgi:hypothetical protein